MRLLYFFYIFGISACGLTNPRYEVLSTPASMDVEVSTVCNSDGATCFEKLIWPDLEGCFGCHDGKTYGEVRLQKNDINTYYNWLLEFSNKDVNKIDGWLRGDHPGGKMSEPSKEQLEKWLKLEDQ